MIKYLTALAFSLIFASAPDGMADDIGWESMPGIGD
jgi:hypothetical protein